MEIILNILSIDTWWTAKTALEQIFWAISLVSSILFIFQFVMTLFGMDFDAEADFDAPSDVDGGDFSLDPSFTLLSVRSVVAFFTFFGWTGVSQLNSGFGLLIVLVSALIAGFAAMFMVGYALFWFARLTQEGNVDINEVLFKSGEVYLTIPGNREGQGKVHVQVGKSLRELDAMTENLTAIQTGKRIRVTEVIDDELLMVELLEENLI